MKRLSIIIPVFKVERYINSCLNSIFSQKYQKEDVEIIIINDGTPDQSMNYIYHHPQLNQMIIIEQCNHGLSVARNVGIERATGEYIWCVDSDDTLVEDSIDYVLNEISRHQEVEIFAILLNRITEDTKLVTKDFYNKYLKVNRTIKGCDYLFDNGRQGPMQQYIIKKSFIEKNDLRYTPGIFHEDGEYSMKAFYLAQNVRLLNKYCYNYLLRSSGSIMTSKSIKNFRDIIYIYKSLDEFGKCKVKKEHQKYWKALISKYLWLLFIWYPQTNDKSSLRDLYKENKKIINNHLFDAFFLKHLSKHDIKQMMIMRFYPHYYFKE